MVDADNEAIYKYGRSSFVVFSLGSDQKMGTVPKIGKPGEECL